MRQRRQALASSIGVEHQMNRVSVFLLCLWLYLIGGSICLMGYIDWKERCHKGSVQTFEGAFLITTWGVLVPAAAILSIVSPPQGSCER